MRCGQCLNHTPFFDNTQALFQYGFPIDAVLQQFKYNKQLSSADFFTHLILQHWTKPQDIDRLIPMPMHPARLGERGFNQSLEVAKQLSKPWSLPLDFDSCSRVKNTPPQATLSLKARIDNVKNAFACQGRLNGEHVLILDDVMTTGATLNALAKALKQAGASRVSCWVIARSVS